MQLDLARIVRNPIVMVSAVLAIVGWLVSFIGACIIGKAGVFWWIVIYEFLLLSGILIILHKQVFNHYCLALLVFLGVSISLLTSAINGLLNSYSTGYQIAGAGSVILIVMQFFWVILFGSTHDSAVFQYTFSTQVPQSNGALREDKMEEHADTMEPPVTGATISIALHPYQANPEDPNELSFAKGESLKILSKSGNWWQAEKEDGTIGIVPSNYFGA